jgi:hypothetical protein
VYVYVGRVGVRGRLKGCRERYTSAKSRQRTTCVEE